MGKVMNKFYKKMIALTGGVVIALAMVGCASTPPSANFTIKPPEQQRIDINDTVTAKLEPASDVSMIDTEKQRLSQLIVSEIDKKKLENSNAGEAREYEVDVVVTRYEKGNAFARFMLAGLGQIHIDAHVIVFTLPTKEKYAEFDIDKTFAWGGIVGASTKIEDVEQGFAEGIAEAVTKLQQ
jgi:Domain of unknown function (DUF4410)